MENYKDTPQDRQNVNPFLHVWMHPKQTARFMIDVKSTGFAILVLSIGYIGSLLSGLIDSNFMPELSPWIIALFCVILAPIAGIIGTAISAFIFWIFGKLFKGTATFSGLFKALSLSAVPFIALIPFYLIWLFTSPESLMDANFIGSIPWIFLANVISNFGCYDLVCCCHCRRCRRSTPNFKLEGILYYLYSYHYFRHRVLYPDYGSRYWHNWCRLNVKKTSPLNDECGRFFYFAIIDFPKFSTV